MAEVLDFVNGRPVRRGTDSSADLQPSVPEEQAKPKAKPKPKARPKPKGFFEQLQNDLTYEFKQIRQDPVRSVMRAVGNAAPVAAGMALGLRSPIGTARPGMAAGAGVADNALRMGYSAFQRLTGAKQADPSRGAVGQVLDQNIDMTYRALGLTPPSQQNRLERDVDMMRRSAALNLGLMAVPGLGPARALAATTKLGKLVKGGTAFGLNEAASQFLDDNTGSGAVDLINMVPGVNLPGGLGARAGQLDMVDSALATFGGNVAVGAGAGAAVGLASKMLPGTMRWLRGNRLKAEEVEARGRLTTAGVLEDSGDGATRPGPAAAAAAPQKPASFAEADAGMRQRLGEQSAPADPDAAARAELTQVEERLAQLQREGAATPSGSEPLAEVLGTGPDPRVIGRPDTYSDVQKWLAQRETEVNPRDQAAYEQWLRSNQQIRGIPSQQMEPGGPVLDADRPLGEFDPELDPWADFDPELPEATDVLKTLDQLDPAVIRQMDEADGSITEMVAQAQQVQQAAPLNPALRFDRVAAPTDRVSRLYLEGAGEAEGWDQVIEALNPTDLRSLAHPSNSPELAARIESLTGKEWDEFTAGDIRVGMRALSKEGRTVLAERLTGKEFMGTDEIAVDPERFQFKQGTDGQGQQTGASLSEEEFWNPRAEDVIEVWDDPADGKTYVVNGHNRLALAKRLGIPSLPVRRIQASSPEAARAYGAISNINDGRGMPEDAARFAQEAGLDTPEKVREAGLDGENSWLRPADQPAPPEQAADPEPPPLTAAQLEEARMRLVGRALRDGEARPNTTPIPELSEGPRVDPSEALADIQARGGIEPDSPAMKALEDEIRLANEQTLQDAAARQDAVEAMKDAYGYDELTFEEKKGLGMTEGWDDVEALMAEADQAMDDYGKAVGEGARLGQITQEVGMGLYDVEDVIATPKIVPGPRAVAPVRPQPLTLTQAAQPEFAMPEVAMGGAPRYGRFTVAFDSDLDRAAYALSAGKPPKGADALREAVQAAGLNPAAVAAHGAKVRAALKELAKGKDKGTLAVPRQPWDAGEVASAPAGWGSVGTSVNSDADIRIIEKAAKALIRKVAGPEATIRFNKLYEDIVKPAAWGGDGIETTQRMGFYRFSEDLIQINGTGVGGLERISEVAFHEAFHRIQFMALGAKDMKVLDSAIARLKVDLGARIDGIAYIESQAVAFQRYARARAFGENPVAALIGTDISALGRLPTGVEKTATAVIAAFDRIADFVERTINAIRGNGFESVQGIFERAFRGSLSESLPDDVIGSSGRMSTIRRWHNFDATRQKLGEEISAVQAQIADIQQRAAEEGC
jgi:hypothetical protein